MQNTVGCRAMATGKYRTVKSIFPRVNMDYSISISIYAKEARRSQQKKIDVKELQSRFRSRIPPCSWSFERFQISSTVAIVSYLHI